MSIEPGASIEWVAYEVCTALHKEAVTAVLSGGGAATIYAPEAHQTNDLDFIITLSAPDVPSAQAILDLGFERDGPAAMYLHPNIPFTLEFPLGPLAVGDEIITEWLTKEKDGLLLHIISPTDSVRDRLAAAIHWKDHNSLLQAAAIAKGNDVDLDVIERWCEREGGAVQFRMLKNYLP